MSPGVAESWTKTKAKSELVVVVGAARPFPFPNPGLGVTEFYLEEIRSHGEGSLGQVDPLNQMNWGSWVQQETLPQKTMWRAHCGEDF